jgi:hypothetical protein
MDRNVYTLDKCLSVRLGRASAIQDYDITVERPGPSASNKSKIFDGSELLAANYYWIQVAEIHGQVYEHLYSPGSFSKSNEERAENANRIASSLKQYHESRGGVSFIF